MLLDFDGLTKECMQLQNHGVEKLEESFDTEGEGGVIMDVQVDIGNLQQLERELEVSCKGRVVVSHVVSLFMSNMFIFFIILKLVFNLTVWLNSLVGFG